MKIYFKNSIPVIVAPKLCLLSKYLYGVPIGAFALFPFIFVRDEEILAKRDYIDHESIHIRQYIETLIVGLLIIGLLQYLYAFLVLKKTRMQAYYYMSHEQEAHQNDMNPNYLKERKWFSYYKYLLPKNKKRMELMDGKRVIL